MEKNDVLDKFSKLVSIQSVSADTGRRSEIKAAAGFIKNELEAIGIKTELLSINGSPPLVFGKLITSENAKTLAVYAHYDVQPEDPVGEWDSPPFVLTERNGKLWGRGAADDKGHVVAVLAALSNLVRSKSLKNNIYIVFEGEEESESLHFEELVKSKKRELETVDAFFVFDSGMKAINVPQIFYGLRGIIAYELSIRIGRTDLHSGVYGNKVLNPVQIMAGLIAGIKDTDSGKILIPGFYDKVRKISDDERTLLAKFKSDDTAGLENAGVYGFVGDFLSSKVFPSFDVNGIESGYTGVGFKTIIPATAKAKFSFRLVENQKADNIDRLVSDFIAEKLPREVRFELKRIGLADPFYTEYNNAFTEKTAGILRDVFRSDVYFNRSGGSIPAAEVLMRLFGKPVVLTGFTLPDENIHAPNENMDSEMFFKGISAMEKIFSQ